MTIDKKFKITKQGMDDLKKEYEELKKIKHSKVGGRDEVPDVLRSEELNPDYLYFLEDLKFLENRINEIDYIINNAELIKTNKKMSTIDVGANVIVEVNGKKDEFNIVETFESNPDKKMISKESPVGKALMGSKEGEIVTVDFPTKRNYKIKKITYHSS
jgi:transcription elongation factor GreA